MKSTWSDTLGSSPGDSFLDRARQRWQRWLNRRIPPASTVTLDQRRIFIFPSATGFFFFICLLVMLIAAINYQNNMSYALTFLLANLFVVAVLHSYANLSGLTLSAVNADPAFAGQRTGFRLRLRCDNRRGHHALRIGWPSGGRRSRFLPRLLSVQVMDGEVQLDIAAESQREVELYLQVGARGWFRPGRLRVESVYPLGLLRCWTWVDLDYRSLVYPAPKAYPEPFASGDNASDGQQLGGTGDDEFFGLRDYREGDSPKRVFWKGVARGEEVQTKEFAAAISDQRWLDWSDFTGLTIEQRLCALTWWVLDYHHREIEYGLRMPDQSLEPATGDRQRDRALRLLALHGIGEQP